MVRSLAYGIGHTVQTVNIRAILEVKLPSDFLKFDI